MKKVFIVAHQALKSDLIDKLHEQGLVHITDLKEEIKQTDLEEELVEHELNLEQIEELEAKVNSALTFLGPFEEKKKGLLAGMLKERLDITLDKFSHIQEKLKFNDVYAKIERLEDELNRVRNRITHLKSLIKRLKPWESLSIKLSEIKPTEKTNIILGELPTANWDDFESEASDIILDSLIELISQDFRITCFFAVVLDAEEEEFHRILHKYGFRHARFSELKQTPKQEILAIQGEVGDLEKKGKMLEDKARKMLYLKWDLVILKEFLTNQHNQLEIENSFAQTRETFMLEGWVSADAQDELKAFIEGISKEVELSFRDPEEDEEPPVVLDNPKWLKPFEVITRLYGVPEYHELDPTPYLSPFFILFFGMCIGDVGYGLALILISWFLRKKLPVSETTKQFFILLIYGGFVSMIVGALTGSWFTIETKVLPQSLKSLIVIEPLDEPDLYLVICVVLGIFHLWLGVVLELFDNVRRGEALNGLFKEGGKLFFLPGAALLATQIFTSIPVVWESMAWWLFGIGIAMIILFSNYESKSIIGRIGGGVFNLYGMSGFIGDTISYARIMALGLATFLIGWAFNIIAGLAFGGASSIGGKIPYVGIVVMVLLYIIIAVCLAFLHGFNLAINLISAFVHPARLQFVEFFTKFFEGGGKKFKPFKVETKNLVIK